MLIQFVLLTEIFKNYNEIIILYVKYTYTTPLPLSTQYFDGNAKLGASGIKEFNTHSL